MKSYSKFIIENKKGTAVASPSPGDPLDPKKRKRIDKKFSDPSNPPKVADPEAPKPKPTPKPEGVKQADVSKKAATYRRAQRVKGATGGKPTGSLSKGNLSFPGDRSGATSRVKADIEARKGFSGSKSGGLKADETSKFVDRSVRQQRTVKQGTPDPFDPKAPKAPARPFKGISKKAKSGLPSIPDPFKSATSNPKKVTPKPKAPSGIGPATSQAISDIRNSMSRRGVKTTEADVAQRYMRKMQDAGRSVDPDFVAAQGPKASSAKPEMVGGPTAPKGTGSKLFSKTRAKGDALRDISKARGADLDKALKNLVSSGDVKRSKPSGPSSSIGFKQFSMKADKVKSGVPSSKVDTLDLGKLSDYKKPSFSSKSSLPYKSFSVDSSSTLPEPVKVSTPKAPPAPKAPSTPKGVTGGLAAPKGGVKTAPGVGPKSYTADEKAIQARQRKMAQTGVDASGKQLSKSERIRAHKVSQNPRAVEVASQNPPSKTFSSGKTSVGPRLSKGFTSSALTLPGQRALPAKKIKLPSPKPELASKVKDALPGFKETRSGAQTLKPAGKLSKLKGFARGAGRVAGPALAVVGAGLDYADDRAKGYNRTSSALRTGAKHLGGAAGGALGSFLGPLGTAAGYAAGHWLTSKVLDKFHNPSKPKTPKQPTGKQKLGAAASSVVGAPIRALTGTPAPKPAPKKEPKKDPSRYLKVNR